MCARNYSPDTGRFFSEDPIGFEAKDLNLFRYVFNNPVNKIDPFGLFTPEIWQALNMNCPGASSQLNSELQALLTAYGVGAGVTVGGSIGLMAGGVAGMSCASSPMTCAAMATNIIDFLDNLGIDGFTTGLPPQTIGGAVGLGLSRANGRGEGQGGMSGGAGAMCGPNNCEKK